MNNFFEQYRTAYIGMESDEMVQQIRQQIEQLQSEFDNKISLITNSLAVAEKSYRDDMAAAEIGIVDSVLLKRQTTKAGGVIASYTKCTPSRKWKDVAVAAGASNDLIELHTTYSPAKVTVSIDTETDTETDDEQILSPVDTLIMREMMSSLLSSLSQ